MIVVGPLILAGRKIMLPMLVRDLEMTPAVLQKARLITGSPQPTTMHGRIVF